MLSDNIKNFRKQINMSQDELAERLGVSRQSISLWETGQTQPTIDNIIALSKIFNVSSDVLLGNGENHSPAPENVEENQIADSENKKGTDKILLIIIIALTALIVAGAILLVSILKGDGDSVEEPPRETPTATISGNITAENTDVIHSTETTVSTAEVTPVPTQAQPPADITVSNPTPVPTQKATPKPQIDLFAYCRDFAIQKGRLNGDYCIYQQPSNRYGGYDNEYFSVSFWNDSNMVEFCLHCPLSDTQSINFYLRMRGGYDGKYEYLSSKYIRETGASIRSATGYIDPAVFYDGYPISCDYYDGSFDGQDEFMEESRVGMCDLIRCLKNFVEVENMDCDFSDFGFTKF